MERRKTSQNLRCSKYGAASMVTNDKKPRSKNCRRYGPPLEAPYRRAQKAVTLLHHIAQTNLCMDLLRKNVALAQF